MTLWQHILVPTDFSEGSEQALLYALAQARHYGARLHLLHVIGEEPEGTLVPGFDSLEAYYDHQEHVAGRHMADAAQAAEQHGVGVHTVVMRHPDVGASVVNYCRRAGIDLVVTGTQGGQGGHRRMLGRTARHVLRQAPCAVMTVASHLTQPPGLIKRVMATVDFSRFTHTVLGVAASMASDHDGYLWMLHVVEPKVRAIYQDGHWAQVALHAPETRSDVYSRLHALTNEVKELPKTTPTVQEGPPAEAIANYARRHAMHLIVQGAHGQTDIDYSHLGSVAEEVVRTAPCPVLTIKAPQPAFDAVRQEKAEGQAARATSEPVA